MRAVYRAAVAPLATARCHPCVRRLDVRIGDVDAGGASHTSLSPGFPIGALSSYASPWICVSSLHPADGKEIMDYPCPAEHQYGSRPH
jgi:hypothetical protein